MRNIDKSKLVLHNQKVEKIADQPLETKEIGYYKDSWNRFKKNKASFIAFIIICFVMFFVLFGPMMKKYDLPRTNKNEAMALDNLTPKIPLLEKIGFFDGTKTITVGKRFAVAMANHELGEGAILAGLPEELFNLDDEALDDFLYNKNFGEYENVASFKIKVDYYKYKNFTRSVMPSDYFMVVDDNAKPGATYKNPIAGVIKTLTQAQFDDYLSKNYIIEIISISPAENPANTTYRVTYNQFAVALGQTPDDTYFWFGTTGEGYDLFTEIWKGARISLTMAISVLVINYTVGLLIGSVVGYYGGVLDLLFSTLR